MQEALAGAVNSLDINTNICIHTLYIINYNIYIYIICIYIYMYMYMCICIFLNPLLNP